MLTNTANKWIINYDVICHECVSSHTNINIDILKFDMSAVTMNQICVLKFMQLSILEIMTDISFKIK